MFQIHTIIDKIQTLKDGGLKITLATQELTTEDTKTLFDLSNKMAWVAIQELSINENQIKIPEEIKEFKEAKSSSQRLRAVLFIHWSQNKQTEDFEIFYRQQMERFINAVKEKLI